MVWVFSGGCTGRQPHQKDVHCKMLTSKLLACSMHTHLKKDVCMVHHTKECVYYSTSIIELCVWCYTSSSDECILLYRSFCSIEECCKRGHLVLPVNSKYHIYNEAKCLWWIAFEVKENISATHIVLIIQWIFGAVEGIRITQFRP